MAHNLDCRSPRWNGKYSSVTNGFQPRLTEAGERHPITRLTADLAENVASWSKLSPLDGVNRTMGARTGAAVLLEHPSLAGAGGEPLPVLAVGEYGDGRSMALAVVCGVLALALGIFAEWKHFPFAKDDSFTYFVSHLLDLRQHPLARWRH